MYGLSGMHYAKEFFDNFKRSSNLLAYFMILPECVLNFDIFVGSTEFWNNLSTSLNFGGLDFEMNLHEYKKKILTVIFFLKEKVPAEISPRITTGIFPVKLPKDFFLLRISLENIPEIIPSN